MQKDVAFKKFMPGVEGIFVRWRNMLFTLSALKSNIQQNPPFVASVNGDYGTFIACH